MTFSISDVTVAEQIGEGAQGVVFKAVAHDLGHKVAVKRLKNSTQEVCDM